MIFRKPYDLFLSFWRGATIGARDFENFWKYHTSFLKPKFYILSLKYVQNPMYSPVGEQKNADIFPDMYG